MKRPRLPKWLRGRIKRPRLSHWVRLIIFDAVIVAALFFLFAAFADYYHVFDVTLAITLVIVEVPLSVTLSALFPHLLEEHRQIDLRARIEASKELRESLIRHYTDIIARMEQWDYQPNESGEMIRGKPAVTARFGGYGVGDVRTAPQNLEPDKSHLKRFDECWKFYSDGHRVFKNYQEKHADSLYSIETILTNVVKESFPALNNRDLIANFTNLIFSKVGYQLQGYAVSPFEAQQPPNEPQPRVESCALPVGLKEAEGFAEALEKIMNTKEVIDKRKVDLDALDEMNSNKAKFDASLKDAIETVRNRDYTDQRMRDGECKDCQERRAKLILLGGW